MCIQGVKFNPQTLIYLLFTAGLPLSQLLVFCVTSQTVMELPPQLLAMQ